jgi:hypothetical protein
MRRRLGSQSDDVVKAKVRSACISSGKGDAFRTIAQQPPKLGIGVAELAREDRRCASLERDLTVGVRINNPV